MHKLLNQIADEIESFSDENKTLASTITFPKPKWNELLDLSKGDLLTSGIVLENDIDQFLSMVFKKGPKVFRGRKVFGLEIKFNGFGQEFSIE